MEKAYCDFMDEITSEDLYEGLLSYGMFADKLPPIFTSVSFFDYCKADNPMFSRKAWNDYVRFSSMRNINIPRVFGIPTPMKYQRLCAVLRENWDNIKCHFHTQTDGESYRVSRIHLRKQHDSKVLFQMNYKNVCVDGSPESDLLFLTNNRYAVCKYVVKADISTCFPSVYTHSLPWALVGKNIAKTNLKNKRMWYNAIDTACSNMKNGETHGLLIGPHASNLLAEIILTKVDRILYDKEYRYLRKIDDFTCYVESYDEAQRFLRDLEDALRVFDLSLNHRKTKVLKQPTALVETWVNTLNQEIGIYCDEMNYKQVESFLDLSLRLVEETEDSAVLNYAIKLLSGRKMTENAKRHYLLRIMHLAVLYPYLLKLMEEYVFTVLKVDNNLIKMFAETIYQDAVTVNNYEAICYVIYFSLIYDFELAELDIVWIIRQKDCLLLLLTWLYYLKANHGKTDATELKPLKNEAKRLRDTEMDRYWLFCYEVLSVGNLSGEWKSMKKAGVSFIEKRVGM